MSDKNPGELFEEGLDKAGDVLDKADQKENQTLDKVKSAQQVLGKATPVPTHFHEVATASELKRRLDWGEPGLTILDLRDREAFNYERITGAMPMPADTLVEQAQAALSPERDLFLYSDSDEQTAEAATQLHSAGFKRVSIVQGGLSAWKDISGQTEGQVSLEAPTITAKATIPFKV
jgi:rhodanese-related sulfurtransferase